MRMVAQGSFRNVRTGSILAKAQEEQHEPANASMTDRVSQRRRLRMSNQSTLEKLKDGIRKFQVEVHAKKAEYYEKVASTPQTPHTLIIACADSRVDVEAITSSGPGEIFVTRNVGNMVPPYSGTPGGVTAVIEYAVAALKVQHVVVCGHSDCGAMKALLHPE